MRSIAEHSVFGVLTATEINSLCLGCLKGLGGEVASLVAAITKGLVFAFATRAPVSDLESDGTKTTSRLRSKMKKSSPSNHAWINIVRLIDQAEKQTGYSLLDTPSKRVLEWIATASQPGSSLYIWTIISKCSVASPATLHKAIKQLKSLGFISVEKDNKDSRRRLVTVTQKGEALLDQLSAEISKGVKSSLK